MTTRKVAAVTGGASGIGAAAAQRLAADGYDIAIIDMNAQGGEANAKAIAGRGRNAKFYTCDVSDAKAVETIAETIEKEMGPVAVLVTAPALIPNT